MSTAATVVLIVVILGAAALFYLRGNNPGDVAPADRLPGREPDPARALFRDGEERPTEDQIARARLGGVRGKKELGEAPLVGQAAENTPRHIDDGHVA